MEKKTDMPRKITVRFLYTHLSQASRLHDVIIESVKDLIILIAPRVEHVDAGAHGRARAGFQAKLLPVVTLIPLDGLEWPPRQDTLAQLDEHTNQTMTYLYTCGGRYT